MFGLAVGYAIASNRDFLHWQCHRKARVLYVDGEMSRTELKRRLVDLVQRNGGVVPDGFALLAREDFEDMPPLNTVEGQEWMDKKIQELGGFDLAIFDNVQALLAGNMKDEEPWAEVLPWVKKLTRRRVGQIWFHHTGHNEGQSYGTKTGSGSLMW